MFGFYYKFIMNQYMGGFGPQAAQAIAWGVRKILSL